MPLDPLPERHWGIEGGAVEPFAAPTKPLRDRNSQALSVWLLSTCTCGLGGLSIPTPNWRAIQLRMVGTLCRGHDVSGLGRQTLVLGMQSITTMMPVRQFGHWRNDFPVSAS